jgi:hypothetical protein
VRHARLRRAGACACVLETQQIVVNIKEKSIFHEVRAKNQRAPAAKRPVSKVVEK